MHGGGAIKFLGGVGGGKRGRVHLLGSGGGVLAISVNPDLVSHDLVLCQPSLASASIIQQQQQQHYHSALPPITSVPNYFHFLYYNLGYTIKYEKKKIHNPNKQSVYHLNVKKDMKHAMCGNRGTCLSCHVPAS